MEKIKDAIPQKLNLIEELLRKEYGYNIETDYTISGLFEDVRILYEAKVNIDKELEDQVKKLQAFKDYVHKRLDDAGIEKEPNGEHSKHGCRIGDRLDILLGMK